MSHHLATRCYGQTQNVAEPMATTCGPCLPFPWRFVCLPRQFSPLSLQPRWTPVSRALRWSEPTQGPELLLQARGRSQSGTNLLLLLVPQSVEGIDTFRLRSFPSAGMPQSSLLLCPRRQGQHSLLLGRLRGGFPPAPQSCGPQSPDLRSSVAFRPRREAPASWQACSAPLHVDMLSNTGSSESELTGDRCSRPLL